MQDLSIWIIAAITILCVLSRPFDIAEWIFASVGATILVVFKLENLEQAKNAFVSGMDVYFFLCGMMMLSEIARNEGVFEWIASKAETAAKGSPFKLFLFIYSLGVFVTMFLSNDATAVVLTPAVYACVKRAKAKPTAHLFACAMIANAASFLLPISNPANLVVYGDHLPGLFDWIKVFFFPSIISIGLTFVLLAVVFRKDLFPEASPNVASSEPVQLSKSGKLALGAIIFFVLVMLSSSVLKLDLGIPTFTAAVIAYSVIGCAKKEFPSESLSKVAWSVVALVGGLFVVIDAVNRARVLDFTKSFLTYSNNLPSVYGKELVSFTSAGIANIANNLPVGLTFGLATQATQLTDSIKNALLIGIDLGPNISVTGSLATVLWLMALRREGEKISFLEFLKVGSIVTPVTLFIAVLAV